MDKKCSSTVRAKKHRILCPASPTETQKRRTQIKREMKCMHACSPFSPHMLSSFPHLPYNFSHLLFTHVRSPLPICMHTILFSPHTLHFFSPTFHICADPLYQYACPTYLTFFPICMPHLPYIFSHLLFIHVPPLPTCMHNSDLRHAARFVYFLHRAGRYLRHATGDALMLQVFTLHSMAVMHTATFYCNMSLLLF
jgi:hypothetical protein